MYIRTKDGLGQLDWQLLRPFDTPAQQQSKGSCSGWMEDAESFSKVVADHYLRTEYPALAGQAKKIWCRPDRKLCQVYYPGDVGVAVSFVSLPHYVIARRVPHPTGPRCEYDFSCSASGRLVLINRSCRKS